MIIECVLKRPEPIEVPMSGDTYKFLPDDAGRLVAEVWKEDHVACFLACSHLYREVTDATPASEARADIPQGRKGIIEALVARGVIFKRTLPTDELRAMLITAIDGAK